MTVRILIAEDSPTQAEALRAALEEGGYAVRVATTGADALRMIATESVDTVISDVVMPGEVDGYELCRRIKETRTDLPVMLLTSLSDPMDIIRGLEAGADNFLTKPYDSAHLLERLALLLATRRSRAEGQGRVRAGVGIHFLGREFTITSEREQILDLLVTTFEDAVRQNHALRQREEELARSRETLAGLYQIAVGLNACRTEQEVLDTALERALRLPALHAGWISLREEEEGFRLGATRNLPEALRRAGAFDDDCLCHRMLLAGELDNVCNITACERLAGAGEDAGGPRYHASVPLFSGDRVLGVMNLVGERDGLGALADDYLTTLYGVGNQIAFALERARRQESLEQLVEERTAALRLSDSILKRITALVLVTDGDGLVRHVTPSIKQMLGYDPEEVLGEGWWRVGYGDPEEAAQARALAARRARSELAPGNGSLERLLRTREGEERWVLWNESKGPEGLLIGVGYDVTDRKELEGQLLHAQKMEAVGRLAGGIAHDFNNVLTAVLATVDLMLLDEPAQWQADDLRDIRSSGERAAGLTKQLLAFSRKQILNPRVVDLTEVMHNLEGMLPRLLGEDVELQVNLASDLKNVRVDPGQVEHVIINLAVNARDAMPRGGRLTIETRNVDLDEEYAESHVDAAPGPHVLIAITDSGVGMDEATRARVFEPFFTTKEVGKGTGLGLSTSYGVVRQSGGHIWLYSEPGRGTTFKIYLPQVEEPADPLGLKTEPAAAQGGSETILVVEDDEPVRAATARILSGAGYTVLEASSGKDALAVAAAHQGALHLLVTDVVMPGLAAPDLAGQLTGEHPGLKVLFTSGYTSDVIARHGLLESGTEFLEKPFARNSLLRRVREVLERS